MKKKIMIPESVYKKRRDKLIKSLTNSVCIIPSHNETIKSNDTHFPFRQESNFFYLTGFNEPNCILILSNSNNRIKSLLFLRDSDPVLEMWNGKRLGVKSAKKSFDLNEVHDIKSFNIELLSKLIKGHIQICIDYRYHHQIFNQIKTCISMLDSQKRLREIIPTSICDLKPILEHYRIQKDSFEIEHIKRSLEVTKVAHHFCMAYARANKNERDLHAALNYIYEKHGHKMAYDHIVAAGNNANTLHYIDNNKRLRDGDLCLIDSGSEYGLYASDITRTFPVNGQFTSEQKEIYSLVLSAQKKALSLAKPGETLTKIHEAASLVLIDGLKQLKIIPKENSKTIFKLKKHFPFYPHGTGHWLGLDVHDPCPYLTPNLKDIKLSTGMVFTCEPGLYLPNNNASVPQQFRGIGIRIEDNILITKNGHQNLSIMIAKEINQIEKMCALPAKEIFNDFL